MFFFSEMRDKLEFPNSGKEKEEKYDDPANDPPLNGFFRNVAFCKITSRYLTLPQNTELTFNPLFRLCFKSVANNPHRAPRNPLSVLWDEVLQPRNGSRCPLDATELSRKTGTGLF